MGNNVNKELKDIHIGIDPDSGKIVFGKFRDGKLSGSIRDITNEFMRVLEEKFPIDTVCLVAVSGKPMYKIIVTSVDRDVSVDGRPVDASLH